MNNNRLTMIIILLLLNLITFNGTVYGTASPHDPIYEVNVNLSTDSFNPAKNETCHITATIRKLDYWLWGGAIPAGYDVVSYAWGIRIQQAIEPYNEYEVLSGNGLSVNNIPYPFASFDWDGKDENGNNVLTGDYYMYVWVNAIYTPETYAYPGVVVEKTIHVQNLILKRVGVYYSHQSGNGLPIAGYPTNATPVTVRAIIWASDGDSTIEKPYTLQDQDEEINDGKWYNTGSEGSQAYSTKPDLTKPVLNVSECPKIYKWPDNWPKPDFEWKVLFNRANNSNITGFNKNYKFKEYTNLFWSSGWGDDGALHGGTWKFKVKAFLDKDKPQEQFVVSADTECATRISVLDSTAPNDPYGGNGDYLRWLSAYLEVPYEWGGHWFGGLEGQNVGGVKIYEGYGTDCAGLVSNGARWAGFNWNSWRAYTFTLKYGPDWEIGTTDDNYYSQKIDTSKIKVGHILNRITQTHTVKNKEIKYPGHVVTVWAVRDGGTKGKIIDVIEATGRPDNKVTINRGRYLQSYYLDQYYELRELNRK